MVGISVGSVGISAEGATDSSGTGKLMSTPGGVSTMTPDTLEGAM